MKGGALPPRPRPAFFFPNHPLPLHTLPPPTSKNNHQKKPTAFFSPNLKTPRSNPLPPYILSTPSRKEDTPKEIINKSYIRKNDTKQNA